MPFSFAHSIMSFISKARTALLARRTAQQPTPKPVPPEKLQEFNNIIIQFKRQAPPSWQATIAWRAHGHRTWAPARAIAQLKLEAMNAPDPLRRVIESWRRLVFHDTGSKTLSCPDHQGPKLVRRENCESGPIAAF